MDKLFWITIWCAGGLLEAGIIWAVFSWVMMQDDINSIEEVKNED